jgi:hypothetical protein
MIDRSLIGASIFCNGRSLLSRLVKLGCFFQKRDGGHFHISKYSHVATIFEADGKLFTIEALQPIVKVYLLDERLIELAKDNTVIIKKLNKSSLDILMENYEIFIKTIKQNIGNKYNTFGALCSGADFPFNLQDSKAMHCSYLTSKLLQVSKVIDDKFNCNEATPDDCLTLLDIQGNNIYK